LFYVIFKILTEGFKRVSCYPAILPLSGPFNRESFFMVKKYIIALLLFFAFFLMGLAGATGDDGVSGCRRLDEKASGDMTKYSLHGNANGPLFFSGISCAIAYRNKVLCAMEMVSFDNTAKVFDYYSSEEIAIGKAYFWLDEKNNETPIAAFGDQESAEKYKTEMGSGVILDYSGLAGRKFN
jgi:hypothetical protein